MFDNGYGLAGDPLVRGICTKPGSVSGCEMECEARLWWKSGGAISLAKLAHLSHVVLAFGRSEQHSIKPLSVGLESTSPSSTKKSG